MPPTPAVDRVRKRTVIDLPTTTTGNGIVSVTELRAFVTALAGEPGDAAVRISTDGLRYEAP